MIHKIKKGKDYLKQGGSENDDSKDDIGFNRDEDSNKSGIYKIMPILKAVNCMKVYSYDAWMMAASLSFASQTTDPL